MTEAEGVKRGDNPVTKAGSVVFGLLPPTNRVTELITFLFYPAFFAVVGTMWVSGEAGHIFGAIAGLVLAVVAIRFRRWGARWAIAHTEKREKQAADDALDEAGEIAPHHNFLHLAELFYVSMEVAVLCIIGAYSLNNLHADHGRAFILFYNANAFIVDFIFAHYSGFDHVIQQHMGTPYQSRIFFIKAGVSLILCIMTYGIVLGGVRMCVGWRRYVVYIRRVGNQITMKNESKALIAALVLFVFFLLGLDALLFGGVEFFLIMDSPPEADWYTYVSVYKVIMYAIGFVMLLMYSLSFLFSFIVMFFVSGSVE